MTPVVDPRSVTGKEPAVERRVPLVVVGAGPAGVAAAIEAARAGVEVLLVDEHPVDVELMAMDVPLYFGQRMSPAVRQRGAMLERVVQANPGLEAAVEADVDLQLGVSVWGAFGRLLGLADAERSWLVGWDRLVLAAGSRDLVIGFRGWEKAGVMGAAGAQALMTRYHAFAARRMVVLGSGALGLETAVLALDRGVEVAAVVEVGHDVRGPIALRERLSRAGVRFYTRHAVREACGSRDEVEGVVLAGLDGERTTEMACDTICLAIGRVPNVELPGVLGCRLVFRPAAGGWVPETDASMQTGLPGVFVAGDCAGIGDEARGAAWLRASLEVGGGDVNVCQCEEVTRRELIGVQPPRYLGGRSDPMRARSLETLLRDGPLNQDQIKRLTRAGMGPCQGRRCREQVALCLADAAGIGVEDIPLPSYRPPVRPLPLAVLWPHDEPESMRAHWVAWFGIPTQFAPHWAGRVDAPAALDD